MWYLVAELLVVVIVVVIVSSLRTAHLLCVQVCHNLSQLCCAKFLNDIEGVLKGRRFTLEFLH